MSAPASFLSRQARILVSPKPVSLSETSAILKALQSFGPVSNFLNPRYMPYLKPKSQTEFYVTFKESEALDKARMANPLVVDVGHDAVDPDEADPFNVRGLWDRKKVERKTFTCFVYPDGKNRRPVEANPYHGPFRVDRLAVSFQDLLRQGAPSTEIADCVRKRHLNKSDRARLEQEAQRLSFYSIGENGEVTGGLMDTWRENLGSKAEVG
jgi:hypothetical protein